MDPENYGEERELSSQESLELITRMIKKARNDYYDTGVSTLLWGGIITVCALVSFFNFYLQWQVLEYIWFLTIAAIIPQIIISIRESKSRKHKGYDSDLTGGIWISFGIAVFLLSYFVNRYQMSQGTSLFLIVYGIPTFTTGYSQRFKPMLYGGLACWVFSVLCTFVTPQYTMLYLAAAAQLAWFIPGLILRRRYLKAKEQHV